MLTRGPATAVATAQVGNGLGQEEDDEDLAQDRAHSGDSVSKAEIGDPMPGTAPAFPAHNSNVNVTGAWSEGFSQPRASRKTSTRRTLPARSGETQAWSRRRPLLAAAQSGER